MSRRQTLGAAHHQAAALRRSSEADDSGSAAQSASSWEDEALASAEPGVSCDDETAPLRRAAEPEHADYDIGVRWESRAWGDCRCCCVTQKTCDMKLRRAVPCVQGGTGSPVRI